ncbi:hypothetical protein H6776_00445 [Candidatus Nomurabacteria bacterium]|nr:hypothetical protein [Candidatus Nomurabacteria bacterium]
MGIFDSLKGMLGGTTEKVMNTAKNAADDMIDSVGDKVEAATGLGGKMIDNLQDKAKDLAHDAIEKAADTLGDAADALGKKADEMEEENK